jgi:predicted nucleotidyltransferase
VADLEKLLGRHVDVVEPDAIRKPLRERILEEAVPL